ncbi:MAG: endonuclease [Planctomycetes bacterium]|nr:endonuclease [Planctomycetota bacterium]
MTRDEIRELLTRSLDDSRLSRGERQALREVFGEALDDPHDLAMARNLAFELINDRCQSEPERERLKWLHELTKLLYGKEHAAQPRAATEVLFSPGTDCRQAILDRFDEARRSIDICVFTITDDGITRAILRAHQRGVRLRVVTDDEKAWDLGADTQRLKESGVPIVFDHDGHMHHKFAIFDARTLLNGSFNWTRAATEDNHENLVASQDEDLVRAFGQQFELLWNRYAARG